MRPPVHDERACYDTQNALARVYLCVNILLVFLFFSSSSFLVVLIVKRGKKITSTYRDDKTVVVVVQQRKIEHGVTLDLNKHEKKEIFFFRFSIMVGC